MVLVFFADDDGTARLGRFELTILLKLKVCTIEKMVSDKSGGFTPTISLKRSLREALENGEQSTL